MKSIVVNGWRITIAGGYPVVISLEHDGKKLPTFTHKELRDLEYAVQRAIHASREELQGTDKAEVD